MIKVHDAAHHHFRDSLKFTRKVSSHDVISNSVWVNVAQRCEFSWGDIQFFLDRYSTLKSFEGLGHERVYEEFIDYQTLRDNNTFLIMLRLLKEKLMRKRFTFTEWIQFGFISTNANCWNYNEMFYTSSKSSTGGVLSERTKLMRDRLWK